MLSFMEVSPVVSVPEGFEIVDTEWMEGCMDSRTDWHVSGFTSHLRRDG